MSVPLSEPIKECKRTPKKFLKKGDGLKRFAAYKPPLPFGTKRKRQTCVTFNLDQNKSSQESTSYLPEYLFDDSINLSTEIPTIAPPKIIHTPIKPPIDHHNYHHQLKKTTLRTSIASTKPTTITSTRRLCHNNNNNDNTKANNTRKKQDGTRYNLRSRRQVVAVVERHITPSPPSPIPSISPTPSSPEEQVKTDIDDLMKKIKEKKTILAQENIVSTHEDSIPSNNNYDYNPSNNLDEDCNENEWLGNSPIFENKKHKLAVNSDFGLTKPSPGTTLLALGKHINQIHKAVNELKENFKNNISSSRTGCICSCNCCGSSAAIEVPKRPRGRVPRKIQCKANDNATLRSSEAADNQTTKSLTIIMEEIAKLHEKFGDLEICQ